MIGGEPVANHEDNCPGGPHLEALRFAEQFTVWAIRVWVKAVQGKAPPGRLLEEGFEVAGCEAALSPLHGLMRTLAVAAERSIDVRCINCRHVSPDEVSFLRAIAGFQRGCYGEGAMLIAGYLPPAAARTAIDHAAALAGHLASAGLLLAPAQAHPHTAAMPVSHTLH